jgi:hypothetical protein
MEIEPKMGKGDNSIRMKMLGKARPEGREVPRRPIARAQDQRNRNLPNFLTILIISYRSLIL